MCPKSIRQCPNCSGIVPIKVMNSLSRGPMFKTTGWQKQAVKSASIKKTYRTYIDYFHFAQITDKNP